MNATIEIIRDVARGYNVSPRPQRVPTKLFVWVGSNDRLRKVYAKSARLTAPRDRLLAALKSNYKFTEAGTPAATRRGFCRPTPGVPVPTVLGGGNAC